MKETLNIYDSNGGLVGEKEKSEVHANGDWHRTFHLWIYSLQKNSTYQIMQVRSNKKQIFPGLIDCAVAGHLKKNEILSDGVREVKEELGISINFSQLKFLGVRKSSFKSNNEFQYIFLLEKDISLTEIYFDTNEVESILKVNNSQLQKLFAGKINKIICDGITIKDGEKIIKDFYLTKESFIPTTDFYYENIASLISENENKIVPSIFSDILSLLDGIELNNSKNISEYIKSKSYIDLNEELKKMLSNNILEKLFFKAIINFNHECHPFVNYLLHSIENEIEPVVKKIYCLGWLKSDESIKALKILAQSKTSYIRSIAVFVLGEICNLEDLYFIGEKLKDSDNLVSKSACFSLGWNQGKERFSILENHLSQVSVEKKVFIEKAIKMFDV